MTIHTGKDFVLIVPHGGEIEADTGEQVDLLTDVLSDNYSPTEVLRSNLPAGTLSVRTPAPSSDKATVTETIDASLLRAGSNVLAIEVHNRSLESSDLLFDLELTSQVCRPWRRRRLGDRRRQGRRRGEDDELTHREKGVSGVSSTTNPEAWRPVPDQTGELEIAIQGNDLL